jgi:hypothetical protein
MLSDPPPSPGPCSIKRDEEKEEMKILWEFLDRQRLWKMWMTGKRLWREPLRQPPMQVWWWIMIQPFEMRPLMLLKFYLSMVSMVIPLQ